MSIARDKRRKERHARLMEFLGPEAVEEIKRVKKLIAKGHLPKLFLMKDEHDQLEREPHPHRKAWTQLTWRQQDTFHYIVNMKNLLENAILREEGNHNAGE